MLIPSTLTIYHILNAANASHLLSNIDLRPSIQQERGYFNTSILDGTYQGSVALLMYSSRRTVLLVINRLVCALE